MHDGTLWPTTGREKRRSWMLFAAFIAAVAITVSLVRAAPWDDEVATIDVVDKVAAEPIAFSEDPLWTTPGEAWEGNPDGLAVGLEHITDTRLVGDHLVLVGGDEDGDLNENGYSAGTIVVLDAATGDPIWTAHNGMPLPEDEQKSLSGFGDTWSIEIVDDGSRPAVVVSYEDYDSESGTELGVVGLAVDSGESLWSIPAVERSDDADYLSIRSATSDDVLVNVGYGRDGEDEIEAMLLNIDTAEPLWSLENFYGAGISGDMVMLVESELVGTTRTTGSFVQAVDRVSGEPVWDSGRGEDDWSYFVSVAAGPVGVYIDEVAVFDITTGKKLAGLDAEYFQWCVTDSEGLIACKLANLGIATVTVSENALRIDKVPDTDGLAPVAVASGWIFTAEEMLPKDTYLAVDPAGNTMRTPGRLADINEEFAVFYTGQIYDDSAWGTSAAAVAIYAIDG